MSNIFNSSDLRRAIYQIVKAVPDPVDYHGGVATADALLADNLLLFHQAPLPNFDMMTHNRLVLVFPLRGVGILRINELALPLKSGLAAMIFPFQFHYFTGFVRGRGAADWLFITCHMRDTSPLNLLRNRILRPNAAAYSVLCEFCQLYRRRPQTRCVRAELAFALARLLERLLVATSRRPTPAQPDGGVHDDHLLSKVGNFVSTHLDKPVQVADVAEHLFMSASHLRRLFRAECGMSLGWYLRRMRILHASRLLFSSDMTISDIGVACGFYTVYSFSRAFKAAMGASPSRYRRMNPHALTPAAARKG